MDRKMFKSILALALICILVVAGLVRIDLVLSTLSLICGLFTPLFVGMGIALVLCRPYKWVRYSFAGAIKKDEKSGLVKAVSIILVYLFAIAVVALLFLFIIPEFIKSISEIIGKYPEYLDGFKNFLVSIEDMFGIEISLFDKLVEYISSFFASLTANGGEDLMQSVIGAFPEIFNVTKSIFSSLANVIIGFALSIYLLASREFLIKNIKKVTYAFLPEKGARRACEVSALTTDVFSKYISSQLLDASIVGIICFIGLSVFGFPYAGLISVLVAVTNVIPFFGPFLGAIPSAVLLLSIDPKWAFFFVIFILIVQQLDGNVIVPRIVGGGTGIPSILVILSIIVGGGLFGVIGMLIGVPTAAVIYKLIKRGTERNLKAKNVVIPVPALPVEEAASSNENGGSGEEKPKKKLHNPFKRGKK